MTEGSLLRPRAGRAGHQAGARRPARGDLPAPRVPHDAAALRRRAARSIPRAMALRRRISATFKDLPGGQLLGPTFDYTHRLLDFDLADGAGRGRHEPVVGRSPDAADAPGEPVPRVIDLLDHEGLIETEDPTPSDRPVARPHPRAARLPGRPRRPPAEPGARRRGVPARARLLDPARLRAQPSVRRRDPLGRGRRRDRARGARLRRSTIAEIAVTECQMVNQFKGSAAAPPQFTRGYGLAFGHAERKAMAMALVDRALRAARARRGRRSRPPRTRSSCSITATTSRPRASCST